MLLPLFFISILSSSCSTLYFKSKQKIPVHVGHHEQFTQQYIVTGSRDFYLWGLYPQEHIVLVDKELNDIGTSAVAIMRLGIDEDNYWKTKFFQIVTFGMYYPVYYKIIAKGLVHDEY